MERNTKKVIAISTIAMLSLLAVNTIPTTTKASPPYTTDWWNNDWFCRKLIKINSNYPSDPQGGGSYQYTFVLIKQDGYDNSAIRLAPWNEGANNYTIVDCEGSCQDDFGDVRFVDRNNNPLSYYISTIKNESNLTYAIVTVRLAMDCYYNYTTGYIWMYYVHNGTISTTSSGQDTFFVYEDFEDGNLYDDYDWETTGDGLWYISSKWTAPDVNQNLHLITPQFSGSPEKVARLSLDISNYLDEPYIPLKIDLWATAEADNTPPSDSRLLLLTSNTAINITGAENLIYWNNYTLYTGIGNHDLEITFYHDSVSTYSEEAGAVDNIIVRNNFEPAPSIETIYAPETNIISYNMYPVTNSSNISVNSTGALTAINITNTENHPMNLTFYVYNWTNSSWDEYKNYTNVTSGNYSAYVPPAYCHNYSVNWYVAIFDTVYNVHIVTNVSYFTLLLPSISDPSPPSGSTNLTTLPLTLSVNISCDENVTVEWYFYNFSASNFTLFATNTSIPPGTVSQTFTNFDGNPVYWYVNVTGDITNITVSSKNVYNFTMKTPVISNESPPSGSVNVSYNTSGVNTSINVSSYENMNITWYYYEWNVTGNATNASGGTWVEYGNETNVTNGSYYKFFPYDYLNNTSFLYYYWMVKVVGVTTDTISTDVYNFTVEIPDILNPSPSDGATNISFTSNGVNTSVEVNITSNVDVKFYWYNWSNSNGTWEEYASFMNVTGDSRYYAYNENFSYGNMLCYWNVTVYLNGSNSPMSIAIYNFTTINNTITLSSASPTGNVSLTSGGINTSIQVNHTIGRNVNITWYWFNYTGDISNLSQWSIYAKDTNVPSNHTYYHQNPNFTTGNTTFTWAVLVREAGGYDYAFEQYIFNTTGAITLSNPSPANNETNVTITENGILTNITVNHTIGKTMDLVWYYSKWVKNESGNWTASWHQYGTTYNVSNGSYSKYLDVPTSSITTYYWYVKARENLSYIDINSSFVPYTFSSIYEFTTEYIPINISITPSYNSTVNATSNGVYTSAYISYNFNGTASVYWYYYDWWSVDEIPSYIGENDTHWKLYGVNLSGYLNHTYSQWLNKANISGIPFYWMVKVIPDGQNDINFTTIGLFYCRTFNITDVEPQDGATNVGLDAGGIRTLVNITCVSPVDIKWNYYDYDSSDWINYGNDISVLSGTYYHSSPYFTYNYSTYTWMLNISEVYIPECFSPIYYQYTYNFSISTFNFTNPIPVQNATSVQMPNGVVRTYITISSNYSGDMDIYWWYYDYDTSEWIQYGVNESVTTGTYSQLLPVTRAGYTYAWRVEVWER